VFSFRCTPNALGRIRNGLETGLGDSLSARLASAIASHIDPSDRCFNLVKDVLLAAEQAQREFSIEAVATKLRHVHRHSGGVFFHQGSAGHLAHIASKPSAQSQKSLPVKQEVRRHHPWSLRHNVAMIHLEQHSSSWP
jgi:hypothetical protein